MSEDELKQGVLQVDLGNILKETRGTPGLSIEVIAQEFRKAFDNDEIDQIINRIKRYEA